MQLNNNVQIYIIGPVKKYVFYYDIFFIIINLFSYILYKYYNEYYLKLCLIST